MECFFCRVNNIYGTIKRLLKVNYVGPNRIIRL